jgi:hypothetical protein
MGMYENLLGRQTQNMRAILNLSNQYDLPLIFMVDTTYFILIFFSPNYIQTHTKQKWNSQD